MKDVELPSGNSAKSEDKKSTENPVIATEKKDTQSSQRSYPVAYKHVPVMVSQKQYEAVETNHTRSINLLDSCGNALLSAMESTLPPTDENGNYIRSVGEYTGANLRQMAKSVCDLVSTKTSVVRSMYAISRDEI